HGAGQTLGDQEATFELVAGVEMYGGFAGGESSLAERDIEANPTILSGDLDGDDTVEFDLSHHDENSYHVVDASGMPSTTVLDGFVIRGGAALFSPTDNKGAGLIVDTGYPSITRCLFERNWAREGGAIYANSARPTVTDCRFRWNRGAGMGAVRGGTYTGGGGAVCSRSGSNVVMVGCEFQGNLSGSGGVVLTFEGIVTLTNCTLVDNTLEYPEGHGGICGYDGASVLLSNSILWANEGSYGSGGESAQIHVVSGATATIDHSCIEGWSGALGGVGNTGADPRFRVEPGDGPDELGDLRLRPGSPLIDAGNSDADTDAGSNGVQPIPPFDLNGLPRFADDPLTPDTGTGGLPFVDMGAHEYQPDDCNYNDVADDDEVAAGSALDCNTNAALDECDLVAGRAEDCDSNAVLDQCEVSVQHDCCTTLHGVGCNDPVIEACVCAVDPYCCQVHWDRLCTEFVMTEGCGICPADDCDANGTPDACDPDFDGDGVPDDCDADIDNDGVVNEDDACDHTPPGEPVNPSGGPLGDMDDDCLVNLDDYFYFEFCLADCGPDEVPAFQECADVFDFDGDEDVDLADFLDFQQVCAGE
ncbi:MAG: right-handed parallel beta-helix repeat-containing protein, partial [bacterium]|nr:right-handed parallel beta-helix repeat-containing protein [bacterium]